MKNLLLSASVGLSLTGLGCFTVLMHDVISSGNAGRETLSLSSQQISSLALGALLIPHAAALPLMAAQRIDD